MAWPERLNWNNTALDLTDLAGLEFSEPEPDRFPCLELARRLSALVDLHPLC